MNKFIYLIIILVLFSCKNKDNKKIYENIECTNINFDSIISISDMELCYKPIFLETKKECLIGFINNIIIDNGFIHIHDKHSNTIFTFSITGKFINKINSSGKGPGEFIDITYFDSYKNNIYILDNLLKKIIKFNISDHTDFSEYKLKDIMFGRFSILDDSTLYATLAYKKGTFFKEVLKYNFVDYSYETYNMDRNKDVDHYNIVFDTPIYKSNNDIYINPVFTNSIYKLNKYGNNKIYNLSGLRFPPKNYLSGMQGEGILELSQSVKYTTSIKQIYENNEYFTLFLYGEKADLLCEQFIITKKNNVVNRISNIDNVISSTIAFNTKGVYKNDFFSFIGHTNIKDEDDEFKIKDLDLQKQFSGTTINSNPIIVLYNYKLTL